MGADALWLTATSATAATDVRVSFPTPPDSLTSGADLQTFRLWLRKTAGATTPTVDVELWEAGSFVATLASDVDVTSTTGELLEVTWDASLLSDQSGADVEVRVVSTPGAPPPRSFSVSPAVSGKTSWDLDVDGPMTVNGSGTWTITPDAGFAGDVELWGGGGGSGGHGSASAGNGGTGGNSTFSGLTANGGAGSLGRTTNTGGTNASTLGTASGGDVNTTGGTSATGTTIGNTSTGGSGGASPNGGAEVAGTSGTSGVSTGGNAGNAPGGGASGGARGSTGGTASARRAVGGARAGGYCKKTYAVGALTAGSPITLTVGGTGAAGTGDQSAGSAGAAGRAKFT